MLSRQRVNPELEDDILTAIITSTEFLEAIRKWYQPHYFSDYGKTIAKWVFDYWDTYHKSPGKDIQRIYDVESEHISPTLAENIASYLYKLNEKYEILSEFNTQYLIDQTRIYFRKKSYEHLFAQGRDLISVGKLEDAVRLHESFRETLQVTSKWENPFDKQTILEHFTSIESDEDIVLTFPDALGELTGSLERGWLVAFLGPMKRGKSFWLQEAVFRAAINKKRVAYINLEMVTKGIRERIYRRVSGLPKRIKPIRYPLFDCYYNQVGECPVSKRRINDITLREDDEDRSLPLWDRANKDYRICAECRRDPEFGHHFIPDVWYTEFTPSKAMEKESILSTSSKFMNHFGDRIRQITYPAGSVSMPDIKRDLDELSYTDKFDPDIIIVDYADIIKSENGREGERDKLNHIWQYLKMIAGERHALVISASQTNRIGMTRDSVRETDLAEDIRKLAHVDALFGINQTEQDKIDQITRMSVIGHRHMDFIRSDEVMILHQLALGTPYLDSEWLSR